MTNKKCIVPEKSTKISKSGYEEIHIPAPIPKPLQPDEKLVLISSLPDWAQAAFGDTNSLNRIQSRLYQHAFDSDANFLLCAPTGAGKTNVALLTMLHEIGKHISDDEELKVDKDEFKIVYIAPMKALVQEMVANFSRKLEPYGITVSELTGDAQLTKAQISSTQVLVSTPEKWDVITRKNNDASYTKLVRLVIIDEIHLLHDDRGPVLEAIVARTLRQSEATQQWIRLVGLSATLPNYVDVGRFMRVDPKKGIFYFDSSYRPCPLAQQYVGLIEKKPLQRMHLMNRIVFEKVMERANQNQVLIFVHSRKDTAKTAKSIRDEAMTTGTIGVFLRESADSRTILTEAADECKDTNLQELLRYGFAIHHAGMTRNDRNKVESLFAAGHVQVLVSTATLAWGVNLPAHTVIIKGTQVYRPEKGGWSELSAQDVLQMLGRAGRPQYDTQGEGIIITTHGELQFYLSLLNQQLPIESQMISGLVNHLNAEIVLGTINNVAEAVDWLGYTYLYVRMLRDGALYGISAEQKETDANLRKFRASLIHSAATVLDRANLIRYDRRVGLLKPTDLARIASHYYITHHSMSTYVTHLKPSCTEIDLTRIFSLSHEFRLIPVRMEEKVELSTLVQKIPIPLRENYDEPSAKINSLLQVYISQLSLEGFALAADMVYITQSAGRILRALFEMCLRRGWARVAHKALDLCKMVERRQWKSMTPLRQLGTVPMDIIRRLERKDFNWDLLFELSAIELGELIRNPGSGKTLHSALDKFPRVTVESATVPLTRELLRLDLTLKPCILNEHGTGELFWIIIEDCDGTNVLFSDSIVLRNQEKRHLTIHVVITDPLPPVYFVTVVADRWLGCQTRLPVNLNKLIVPERRGVVLEMTEDLIDVVKDYSMYPQIIEAYAEVELNGVQSAVIPAAFKSDKNIFLGASANLDILIVAEFAIWRSFIQNPNCLVVYTSSKSEVLRCTKERWTSIFKDYLIAELTGDNATDLRLIEQGGIILTLPKNWDQLSRKWKTRKSIQRIALFIVDGIHHVYSDPILEIILSRIRFMSAQLEREEIRIVALGLPVWNPRELCAWLGIREETCFNVDGFGGVNVKLIGHNYSHYPSMILAMMRPILKLTREYEKCFVYVSDAKQARSVAFNIAQANIDSIEEIVDYESSGDEDEILMECLRRKVAFYDGKIQLNRLLSMASIIVLPRDASYLITAETRVPMVLLLGTLEYRGREDGCIDYEIADILSMVATANKEAIIMCHSARRPTLTKLLEDPIWVESTLDTHLSDTLNAEIAVKTITNTQDAVDYLTWTYIYRRLARNPNYYGLISVGQLALSEYLSELVESSLHELESARCIQIEDDQIGSLNLGLIAAYYGVTCRSVEMLGLSLTASSRIRGVLECVAAATEFDDLPIREQEPALLERLHSRVPMKIPSPNYSDPHVKAFLLLQAHCSRIILPRPGLEDDRYLILGQVIPLIQAVVDVASSYGHLRTCLAAMECSQMIVQAVWNSDPLIRQILDGKELELAVSKGITSVYDLDEETFRAISAEKQEIVAKAVNRFPSLDVRLGFDSNTILVGEEAVLRATISRTAASGPVIAPCYPRRKEEAWWLLVGANDHLLGIKRIVVDDASNVSISIPMDQVGKTAAKAYLVCDSYAGADQEFDIPFEVVAQSTDTEK